MGRVEGKVVVVTGAGRGQGRSHAVRLAEEGADIIALDICADVPIAEYPMATPEDLEETALLVRKTGRRAVTAAVDVRDRFALGTALDAAVAELGGLHVVVANAGICPAGMDRPLTAWGDTVDTNLSGVLNTVHAALPHLGEGSSIILIGSAAGYTAMFGEPGPMGPGGTGYAFAKQTLIHYVEWLSPFLSQRSMRINAIHPTNVDTPMIHNEGMYRIFRPDLEHPTREDAEPVFPMVQGMPLPYIDPLDVSHAVCFLASDESRYVTATQLRVDAGAIVKMGK